MPAASVKAKVARCAAICFTAAGMFAALSSASIAQVPGGGEPGPDMPYGSYYDRYQGGLYYNEYTLPIYGGPTSDLFSYEGPNRAAMERSTR
jgi:hypothetical protein